MDLFVAQISLKETTVQGTERLEKDSKSGPVKAGAKLDVKISGTIRVLEVISISDKIVKFKFDSQEFEIPLSGQHIIHNIIDGITTEFEIKVIGISIEKPSPPTPKLPELKMPLHYFNQMQPLLQKLEKDLSSKVIVYYVPGNNMISQIDPDYFAELLRDANKYPKISLVVRSVGGDSMACLRIASILRHYCDELEIIIPSVATSAATLLSLAADKIKFTPLGYLGPVDTQLINIKDEKLTNMNYSQISSDSFRRAREMLEKETRDTGPYTELFKHIHPLVVAEVDRLASRSKQTAEVMMKMQKNPFDERKIDWIANHLVYDYPSHGFPILFEEAKKIGLEVEMLPNPICNTLWDLWKYQRAITLEKVTNYNPEWYHVEQNMVVIETAGKRLVRRYSFDNRFSVSERRWQYTNDNSNWKKYLPSEKPGEQPKILSVEVEDTQS